MTKAITEKRQCSAQVLPEGQWGAFHPYQCSKNATVQRDGKWYCKIHDPEYRKAKAANRTTEWKRKMNSEIAGNIARGQCEKINPDNPRAVAESIGDMYEALKELLDFYHLPKGSIDRPYLADVVRQAKKALIKAEGKETGSPVS